MPTQQCDIQPNTAMEAVQAEALPAKNRRELSVDLFRGGVLMLMLIANMPPSGLPWWMYHASHSGAAILTWVDFVWPAFLFTTGLSLVLGLSAALDRGQSWQRITIHVLQRGLALIWLGTLFSWARYDGSVVGIADVKLFRLITYFAIVGAFVNSKRLTFFRFKWGKRSILTLKLLGWSWLLYATVTVRYAPKTDQVWSLMNYLANFSLPPSVIESFGYAFLWGAPIWLLTRRSTAFRLTVMGICYLAALNWSSNSFLRSCFAPLFFQMSPADYRIIYVLGGTLVGDALLNAKESPVFFRRYLAVMVFVCCSGVILANTHGEWGVHAGNIPQRTLSVIAVCTGIYLMVWQLSRCYQGNMWFPFRHLGKNTLLGYLASQSLLHFWVQSLTGLWIIQLMPHKGVLGLVITVVLITFYTLWVWIHNRASIYLRL
jgi:hypothetical protein